MDIRHILVTGGAGYIGSHLVDRLVLDGHHVTVLDDLSRGRMDNLAEARRAPDRHLRFQRCDLVDDAMAPLVIHARPEVVFHLAAHIDVRRSVEDPMYDASVNVLGSLNLLEAVRKHSPKTRAVFASTGGALYGDNTTPPNFEEFKKLHPAFAHLDAKRLIKDGNSAPLHDGAARYFKEKGLM